MMQLLIDTHAFLWFISGDPRCSTVARDSIASPQNQIYLSVASLWEISIKLSLRKLTLSMPFDQLIKNQLLLNSIDILQIDIPDLEILTNLPFHHRDPFERMLIAQAQSRSMPLVSADQAFDKYEIQRLW